MNLRKGGVDLEKEGGMTPLANYGNIRNLLSFRLKNSISQNIRKICFCFLGWISFIFQAWTEKCQVPFPEIYEKLSFEKIYEKLSFDEI